MKLLSFTLLLYFFMSSFFGLSQSNDTLGLKRLYWAVIPGVVMSSTYEKPTGAVWADNGGIQFEIGNYRAFNTRKRTTGFFRFTWIRAGIHLEGLLLAPAHIGFGVHVDYGPKRSLDLSLNTGIVVASDDALSPDFEFAVVVYPQIRFNFNRFSFGVEYSYKKNEDSPIDYLNGIHYFGLVLGARGGKRIN